MRPQMVVVKIEELAGGQKDRLVEVWRGSE
jgi:hypothetical protein